MNNEQVIPNKSTHDAPSFDLLLDGQAVNSGYQIYSVMVSREVNRIPTAKIVIRDGEAAIQDFEISSTNDFVPGKKVEIKAGYDRNNETIFKGLIIKHYIRVMGNGFSTLCIECKDESVKMTLGRKSKYFLKAKDSAIIEEVLGEYSLKGTVEATKLEHKEMVQHDCTDWDFVLSRAEVNGLLLLVEDGKVNAQAPKVSGEPALELAFGANLIEFEAEMDARHQWTKVQANSWDYSTQKLFESEATSSSFKDHGNIKPATLADVGGLKAYQLRHSGAPIEAEIKAWADATILRSHLAKVCGRARFKGYFAINPGMIVKLGGVGDRFNGNAYVTGVRYEQRDGVCFVDLQFGLPPEWLHQKTELMAGPAAGLVPGIRGLQIGKVVQIHEDPDGQDRIMVKLPIIDDKAKGIWARVACLDAGKERGTYFRPEVDDEVIVGFLNDDPRYAVVLGMLNSSTLPAPIKAAEPHDEKGIVTRDKLKLIFEDTRKKITIETPAGNQIVLDEEEKTLLLKDQNDNSITLSPDGITIKSPKDITIEATGKMDVKATQDLTMQGMNVKGSAQAQLEWAGQAGAKFSSSAIAEISGSLVKIN